MTYARYSTYGELYTAMATTTGEIPIAIYRTEENADSVTAAQNVSTCTSMQCTFINISCDHKLYKLNLHSVDMKLEKDY